MLITPTELKTYTDNEDIKNREDVKLNVDIIQAQSVVSDICKHNFDKSEYPTLPEEVRVSLLLLSEYFAIKALSVKKSGFKSETFDDYSYTMNDVEIVMPDVSSLLKPYIKLEKVEVKPCQMKLRIL